MSERTIGLIDGDALAKAIQLRLSSGTLNTHERIGYAYLQDILATNAFKPATPAPKRELEYDLDKAWKYCAIENRHTFENYSNDAITLFVEGLFEAAVVKESDKESMLEAIQRLKDFVAEALERGEKDRPFIIGTREFIASADAQEGTR